MPSLWPFMAVLFLSAAPALAPALAEESERQRDLFQLYYDAGVLEYCGGVTDSVYKGFHRRRNALLARHGIDEAEDRRVRIRAYTAADLEYLDRGIGGQRHWCRTEGEDAVRRFLSD